MKRSFLNRKSAGIVLFIIAVSLLCPFYGYSQVRTGIEGEVININYSLHVAFTDIGEQYLQPGDILEVETVSNGFIYVQVLETSKVISKLGLSSTVEKYFNVRRKDFEKIKIGDVVRKIDSSILQEDPEQASSNVRGNPRQSENPIVQKDSACVSEGECQRKIEQLEGKILLLKQKLMIMKEMIKELQ